MALGVEEDFNKQLENSYRWGVFDYGGKPDKGRTCWGPPHFWSEGGTKFMRLPLYPYYHRKSLFNSPKDDIHYSDVFMGVEIFSNYDPSLNQPRWGRPRKGERYEFEARMRVRIKPGVVAGFYPYWDHPPADDLFRGKPATRDELDFEFLGNYTNSKNKRVWLVTWNQGNQDGTHGLHDMPDLTGWKFRDWNYYKIVWYQRGAKLGAEFYARKDSAAGYGKPLWTSTTNIPDEALTVHFNIWAPLPPPPPPPGEPDTGFGIAHSPSLKTASQWKVPQGEPADYWSRDRNWQRLPALGALEVDQLNIRKFKNNQEVPLPPWRTE